MEGSVWEWVALGLMLAQNRVALKRSGATARIAAMEELVLMLSQLWAGWVEKIE